MAEQKSQTLPGSPKPSLPSESSPHEGATPQPHPGVSRNPERVLATAVCVSYGLMCVTAAAAEATAAQKGEALCALCQAVLDGGTQPV